LVPIVYVAKEYQLVMKESNWNKTRKHMNQIHLIIRKILKVGLINQAPTQEKPNTCI
jgi:hypothetical protein